MNIGQDYLFTKTTGGNKLKYLGEFLIHINFVLDNFYNIFDQLKIPFFLYPYLIYFLH